MHAVFPYVSPADAAKVYRNAAAALTVSVAEVDDPGYSALLQAQAAVLEATADLFQDRAANKAASGSGRPSEPIPPCSGCNRPDLTAAMAKFSLTNWERVLCPACQKTAGAKLQNAHGAPQEARQDVSPPAEALSPPPDVPEPLSPPERDSLVKWIDYAEKSELLPADRLQELHDSLASGEPIPRRGAHAVIAEIRAADNAMTGSANAAAPPRRLTSALRPLKGA